MAQIEKSGDRFVIVAHEDDMVTHFAKELQNGCDAEDIIKLNESNPVCAGVTKKTSFKKGTVVWLPAAACVAYLDSATFVKAEAEASSAAADASAKVAKAEAEAEAAKAEATAAKAEAAASKAEVEALKAAAEEAKGAPTATAATGSKHQSRTIPDEHQPRTIPDASAIAARLAQLDETAKVKQAEADCSRKYISDPSAPASALHAVKTALQEAEAALARCGTMKRTLQQAVSEHGNAEEAEKAAKQRRGSAEMALAEAYEQCAE